MKIKNMNLTWQSKAAIVFGSIIEIAALFFRPVYTEKKLESTVSDLVGSEAKGEFSVILVSEAEVGNHIDTGPLLSGTESVVVSVETEIWIGLVVAIPIIIGVMVLLIESVDE